MTVEPYHLNQELKYQVVKWSGPDNLETFEKHIKNSTSRAQLNDHGFLDPDCISYSFNSHGFRDDEFTNEPAVMALGCSFTQGIGVSYCDTWTKQLSDKLGMRVWNLGVSGSSSDTAYRLAEYWLDHLNIKCVAMLVPSIERFELWDQGRAHVVMHSSRVDLDIDTYKKIYWTNVENGQINQNKNLQAIKYLCHKKQILFCHQLKDQWSNIDVSRDLGHWGRKSNQVIAEEMYNSLKAVSL